MAKVKPPEVSAPEVTITLPVGELDEKAYHSNRIDLALDSVQTSAVHRLLRGLKDADAKLNNGRHIYAPVDVVRFILEQV